MSFKDDATDDAYVAFICGMYLDLDLLMLIVKISRMLRPVSISH